MISIRENGDSGARKWLYDLGEAHRFVEALASQWDNYVDPRDAMTDPDGTQWTPIGAVGGKGRPATDFAGFANETELTAAREACRRALGYSEFVVNGHEVRINYAVDDGFKFKAAPCDHDDEEAAPASPKEVRMLQEFIDELLEENKWPERQRETVLRLDRDGERFMRKFRTPDGMTKFRFVEPWQVTSAAITQTPDIDMGIETEPGDAETVVAFWIADDAGSQPVRVDASEVQHIKANVDMNVRRGVPLFWPAIKNVRRIASTLRNIGVKDELAAAMCLNRRHDEKTGLSAISALQSSVGVLQRNNPLTGTIDNLSPYGPGSVLDTRKSTEYEALNLAEGISEMVVGLDAMLRSLAACAGLPEFMLTSNAANGNYASTMVAEGPAVRTFRTIQSTLKCYDMELIKEAIEYAELVGRLPAGISERCEVQVELPQLVTRDAAAEASANDTYVRMRVLSKQTLSGRLGLKYDQEQKNIKADEEANPPQPSPNVAAVQAAALQGQVSRAATLEQLQAEIEAAYGRLTESSAANKQE